MSVILKHASVISNYVSVILEHASVILKHASVILKNVSVILKHVSVILKHASVILKHASVISKHVSVISKHVSVILKNVSVILKHVSVILKHMYVISKHASVISNHMSVISNHASVISKIKMVLDSITLYFYLLILGRILIMTKTILKPLLILLLTLGGFLADFYSKEWAEKNLRNKPAITLSKHFLDLGFVENRGMVFGMFNGKMSEFSSGIMAAIRMLILLGLTLFIWIKRKQSFLILLPFLLFWTGAVGNLVDSLFKGYVVDFIHIHAGTILNWPFYFNLADAYVTIGMVLVVIYELIGIISNRPSVLTSSRLVRETGGDTRK